MDSNFITTDHHTGNPLLGACFSLVSIVSASMCWVSIQQVQTLAAIIASVAATVSAIMGANHFYWSVKEKKDAYRKRQIEKP